MGRLKSSRFLTNNSGSSRAESIKEELTVTILSDEEESDHNKSPRENKASVESISEGASVINEDSVASDTRMGRRQSCGGNDNSMRRRRAAQGHSSQRRIGTGQESPAEAPEAPPTPSATRIRQRRRGSTGGTLPLMGASGESQTSGFIEELKRRSKLPSLQGDIKSGHSRETESSGHRRSRHERSGHSRLSADEGWMQDIVKPLNESSPDISTGTAATSCSSTIDSSRIDRLINLEEEENEEEEAPKEPATPGRRLARLSSVTQLFRKGGGGEGSGTRAPPETSQGTKLMSRFMKNESGGKQSTSNEEVSSGKVAGFSKKNRRASVG